MINHFLRYLDSLICRIVKKNVSIEYIEVNPKSNSEWWYWYGGPDDYDVPISRIPFYTRPWKRHATPQERLDNFLKAANRLEYTQETSAIINKTARFLVKLSETYVYDRPD